MKYIRTKEHGICEIIRESEYTLSYENSYVSGCIWKEEFKDQIQYADTIEELIKVGDLISFTTPLGKETRVIESHRELITILLEIENKEIELLKLYIKKGDNYMLVWDKERGFIK